MRQTCYFVRAIGQKYKKNKVNPYLKNQTRNNVLPLLRGIPGLGLFGFFSLLRFLIMACVEGFLSSCFAYFLCVCSLVLWACFTLLLFWFYGAFYGLLPVSRGRG